MVSEQAVSVNQESPSFRPGECQFDIEQLLQPFQRFGVHLGLSRIESLLGKLDNPHRRVPTIHVAGSNGKGSVCAYLSAVLTEAGYRVGRYTSPHLIHWRERICLNEQPISPGELVGLLTKIQGLITENEESPTQFEVITAAAWLYFAQSQVDVAVVEVGLGGRLDATNVCDRPLVTVITSISREHWQVLGSTLTAIATEKAGILKSGSPAVIGKLPKEAESVIRHRLAHLECAAIWTEPAIKLSDGRGRYGEITYPLPLLGDVQLTNSAIAIATLQILQAQGWQISSSAIATGMGKTRWPGRIQWVQWHDYTLLIDGAHNPDSARMLRNYVDTINKPITWVIGMLSTKDHQEIFRELLRPSDYLYLLPVPDHSSALPAELALLAKAICPQLDKLETHEDLAMALSQAVANSERVTVLCGSLYLLGYFLSKVQSDQVQLPC